MEDQAALLEAIQRARQLAAKINPQNQPVKRPASQLDTSGPIKVTLAYEKPVGKPAEQESRQRSTSRDYNRNERDSRDRDYKDSRDSNYNREPRDSSRNMGHSITSHDPYANSGPPPPSSRNSDEKIEIIIPHAVIGLVIGKGGENIKRIQNETGATVRVDPNTVDERGNKLCTITGTKSAVEDARIQVENVIESAGTSKRPRLQSEGGDSYRLKIPASRTGAIIGKGGETIKSIKQQSGCDIELDKVAKDCGPEESIFIIRGAQDKILKARALIEARLASRTHRDGGMRDNPIDSHQSHSNRSSTKGVITGANAAPVSQGQFSEMSSTFPGKSYRYHHASFNGVIDDIDPNQIYFNDLHHSINSTHWSAKFCRYDSRMGCLFCPVFYLL